jgi:hypothetical protein
MKYPLSLLFSSSLLLACSDSNPSTDASVASKDVAVSDVNASVDVHSTLDVVVVVDGSPQVDIAPDQGTPPRDAPADAPSTVDTAPATDVSVTDMCPTRCVTNCAQGCFDLGACVSTGAAIDVTPNIFTLGAVLPAGPTGDVATLYYRRVGDRTWSQGQPLVRLPDGRFAGSVFGTLPATRYEIRASVGTAISCATTSTEALVSAHTTSNTLYVRAGAAAGGNGSMAQPFATLQAGITAAVAGTDVVVLPGVYREAITVNGRGGREGAFLRIMGMPGAILDGADAMAQATGLTWRSDGANVYSAPWTGDPRYISREGQRLYHYTSLTGLRAGLGDDSVAIA